MAPFPRPLAKVEHVEYLALCPLIKFALVHLIYVSLKLSLLLKLPSKPLLKPLNANHNSRFKQMCSLKSSPIISSIRGYKSLLNL